MTCCSIYQIFEMLPSSSGFPARIVSCMAFCSCPSKEVAISCLLQLISSFVREMGQIGFSIGQMDGQGLLMFQNDTEREQRLTSSRKQASHARISRSCSPINQKSIVSQAEKQEAKAVRMLTIMKESEHLIAVLLDSQLILQLVYKIETTLAARFDSQSTPWKISSQKCSYLSSCIKQSSRESSPCRNSTSDIAIWMQLHTAACESLYSFRSLIAFGRENSGRLQRQLMFQAGAFTKPRRQVQLPGGLYPGLPDSSLSWELALKKESSEMVLMVWYRLEQLVQPLALTTSQLSMWLGVMAWSLQKRQNQCSVALKSITGQDQKFIGELASNERTQEGEPVLDRQLFYRITGSVVMFWRGQSSLAGTTTPAQDCPHCFLLEFAFLSNQLSFKKEQFDLLTQYNQSAGYLAGTVPVINSEGTSPLDVGAAHESEILGTHSQEGNSKVTPEDALAAVVPSWELEGQQGLVVFRTSGCNCQVIDIPLQGDYSDSTSKLFSPQGRRPLRI